MLYFLPSISDDIRQGPLPSKEERQRLLQGFIAAEHVNLERIEEEVPAEVILPHHGEGHSHGHHHGNHFENVPHQFEGGDLEDYQVHPTEPSYEDYQYYYYEDYEDIPDWAKV